MIMILLMVIIVAMVAEVANSGHRGLDLLQLEVNARTFPVGLGFRV